MLFSECLNSDQARNFESSTTKHLSACRGWKILDHSIPSDGERASGAILLQTPGYAYNNKTWKKLDWMKYVPVLAHASAFIV